MNKNKIIWVVAVLLVGNVFASAAAFAQVKDVPADHWAHQAVNTAVNKGYLTVFEDGTFQGSRAVDRFALANTIARLLEDIEVARVKGTSADLTLIRELSLEFEEDLATWYANQQALQDDLKAARDDALAAEERVSRIVGAQVGLEEQVESLQATVSELQGSLSEVQFGVGLVRDLLGEQTGGLFENEERVGELLKALRLLEEEILLHEQDIDHLGVQLGNLSQENVLAFKNLELTDARLFEELEELWVELASLADSTELSELAKQVGGLSVELDELYVFNQGFEDDLLEIAVRLQRETQKRDELAQQLTDLYSGLEVLHTELIELREDQSKFDELKEQMAIDVNAQMNAALIREQRLERQIKSIEEEFEDYRIQTAKELKSTKTLATMGVAAGIVGAVVAIIAAFK